MSLPLYKQVCLRCTSGGGLARRFILFPTGKPYFVYPKHKICRSLVLEDGGWWKSCGGASGVLLLWVVVVLIFRLCVRGFCAEGLILGCPGLELGEAEADEKVGVPLPLLPPHRALWLGVQ